METTDARACAGRLLLAATPMGQAGDASARLREALATADVVAAEDTRRLRALARDLEVEITGRVISYFDQNEAQRAPMLVSQMRDGATVVVVTDAGMPSVSDPGFRLVCACIDADIPVTCLPGPSAVTTALALSGLPADRFAFDGFAPRKPGPRQRWLQQLATEPRTVVFFEAPHRLAATLADAVPTLGPDRRVAVCRELTKTHEEVRRGRLADVASWAADGVRGEITVVVEPAPAPEVDINDLVAAVQDLTANGTRLKDACASVAATSGTAKRDLYQAVLASRAQLE